ncbi:lactate permease [Arcobacter ellisii]|uniref:Lactate permease n=1 Tax=Arcobacter ellisii TaxID=913109 RepID=A0ABM6YLP0_9BACT|nr:lactate permease [Arcobacter ellisii]AXX95719.1 hypothetical protein AELL_2077 [Arcobacter ellisii]
MERVDRFNKRKQILKESKNLILSSEVRNENIVEHTLVKKTLNRLEETYNTDFSISSTEVKEFLEDFQKKFHEEKFNKLIIDCKNEVIKSIVTPFGLGKIIAVYDKVGGNVDTINNARNGIYSTEEEQNKYANRGDYNSDEYHKDTDFININRKYSQDRKDGNATDYMTGSKLDPNQSHDLDHIKSAKEIHDDAGRVLAEIDGSTLANTETNLKPTTATNNRSKKADDMETFLNKKNERLEKIDELKQKDSLNIQEQNELRKLEELSKIDDKKAMESDEKARKEIDKEINTAYYTSEKFVKNAAITGASEGFKMGIQQALGLVITEFFTALFDEIIDIYKNGFSNGFEDEKFFTILKERLIRIGNKIKEKWKEAAIAFKDGFISGFISNLVTVAINMFVTTSKKVARIIREGIFSLFRAVKMLVFPPENMTYEDAMHEAKKLLATGVLISLGVLAEESVEKLISTVPILLPYSSTLSTVFIGTLTGLSVTMTVYYIDKKRDDEELFKNLVESVKEDMDEINRTLELNELKIFKA